MSHEKNAKDSKCCCKGKQEKTATNNQWTNSNVSKQPDRRPRRDGPGGDCGCGR